MDTLSVFEVFYSYIQRDKGLWSTKWYQNSIQVRKSVIVKRKIVFGFILLWHTYFSSFSEFMVMYYYNTQQWVPPHRQMAAFSWNIVKCEIPLYVSCMRHVFATSIQSGMCSSTVQVISRTKSVYAFFMSQKLWYSEKGEACSRSVYKSIWKHIPT